MQSAEYFKLNQMLGIICHFSQEIMWQGLSSHVTSLWAPLGGGMQVRASKNSDIVLFCI